ncbi:MAG: peptide-methionine (R)-S-oxide reductase MsrB [Bryobacteraceae bacterium]|jgi:peptide-methionine (R)-S-oxide reductase
MILEGYITRRSLMRLCAVTAAVPSARAEDSEQEVTIVEFNDGGEKTGVVRVKKVLHTEAEWRKMLTLKQYYVTRKAASDLAFYGTYFKLHDAGLYRCLCCANAVFSSEAKFDTQTGFACFSAPIAEENIRTAVDATEEPKRVGVICKRCDAHLGYEYNDRPEPTNMRYAINESAVKFVPFRKSASG